MKLFTKIRNKKSGLMIISLLILGALNSCSLIIEDDLSAEIIKINQPINNYKYADSNVDFWWNEVEGADYYQLQIVVPNFDSIINLVIDSNISGTKFQWTFSPGKYVWRIRACNSSSYSNYQVYTFEVDSSLNLENSQIILLSPQPYYFLNANLLQFKWLKIYSAEYYYFSLFDQANVPIFFEYNTNETTLNIPNSNLTDSLVDGYYRWGVRCANSVSSSLYTYSYFTIDRTKPTKPNLLSPNANSFHASGNLNFIWQAGGDINYYYDSVFIYQDSNQVNLSKSYKTTQNSIIDSLSTGIYYWHVTTFDKVGNKSDKSEIRKLSIL